MKEDDDILDLHKIRDTNPVVKLLTVFTIVKFLVLLGIGLWIVGYFIYGVLSIRYFN